MAARTFVASVALGAAGLAWALFVLTRMLNAWQIGSVAGAHELTLFGARLSYPAANSAALVLAALAALGLAVMVAAAAADGDRSALANAMLRFAGPSGHGAVGLDPERVDRLLGESPPPRFPLALCIGMAIVLAALVALAVLAAHAAAGTATLGLPFLSSAPCITVLAVIPICAIGGGFSFTRLLAARRRHDDRVAA
jgi:hypothetical protein